MYLRFSEFNDPESYRVDNLLTDDFAFVNNSGSLFKVEIGIKDIYFIFFLVCVNGKAKLTREDHCDGLGDCLPACPTDAISFEEREAAAYDEEAVKTAKMKKISVWY